MTIRKIDHIGIVVQDLAAAKQFFLDLGLVLQGEATVEGEWVGKVIGLKNVKSDIAMLQTPDGVTSVELSKFHTPPSEKDMQVPSSNTLGIRHICFAVENLDAILTKLQKNGTELVGEVQNYENMYKLCYVRGPEGILLELAEQLT
jgi:catechol 2,3-dioxygenase-like lactoylglutathione lyase family enzyme